jgi:hypothetical protein
VENNQNPVQLTGDQVYQYAANLLVHEKKSADETIQSLTSMGVDAANAVEIVNNLQVQISDVKKEKAKKDILYGALWCGGGIIATLANIGFYFWGAILFGGIQLVRGLINYTRSN